MLKFSASAQSLNIKLDLAFNNVKPKDWYFVFDLVRFRTGLGCVRLTNQNYILAWNMMPPLGTWLLSLLEVVGGL